MRKVDREKLPFNLKKDKEREMRKVDREKLRLTSKKIEREKKI